MYFFLCVCHNNCKLAVSHDYSFNGDIYIFPSLDPVSILNNDREIFPSMAVINYFPIYMNTDNPVLAINCLSTAENPLLQWESMNVSSLSDGEITQEAADEINALNVTYFSSISANQRLISLLIHPFGEQFTGYYFCRSQQSNISRKVFTTLTNPLWELISPRNVTLPMGAEVSIVIRYGDSSSGYENRGSGFLYSLIFLPCVATQPDEVLLFGFSNRFSNEIVYTFRARIDVDSGEYRWNG